MSWKSVRFHYKRHFRRLLFGEKMITKAEEQEIKQNMPEIGMPMVMDRYWSVTDIAEFAFSPNAAYEKFIMHKRTIPNAPMLKGTIEHEARRIVSKKLSAIYISSESTSDIISKSYQEIQCVIDSLLGSPDFSSNLDLLLTNAEKNKFRDNLCKRFSREEDDRVINAEYLMMKGISNIEIVKTLFPIWTEHSISSEKLHCSGRIDAIFEIDSLLVPVDYKSYGYFPGMDLTAEKIQIALYLMMMEEKGYHTAPYGFLFLTATGTMLPVVLTVELRDNIHTLISRLDEFILNSHMEYEKKQQILESVPAYNEKNCEEGNFDKDCASLYEFSAQILDKMMRQNGEFNIFPIEGGDQ
jgi:CRISPR/Cas system-associated exonuclease Cas4 (RecB family)